MGNSESNKNNRLIYILLFILATNGNFIWESLILILFPPS